MSMNHGSIVLLFGLVLVVSANADYTIDPYDYFDGQNAQALPERK